MERPGRRTVVVAALLVYSTLAALLAARVAGETADDFFITYRYAQNLVSGHGYVFNPGERVLTTSAPGWGLLLALGHRVTGISLPVLGTWGTALSLVGIAGLLLWDGQRRGRAPEAFLAGLLLVTCSYIWTHNGFEYPPALWLLLSAAVLGRHRPAAAASLAGLAVWCRPDSGLIAAGLALLLAAEDRRSGRRPRLTFTLVLAAIVAGGLILAFLYYGHALPQTLAAKRLQAEWRPEIWLSGRRFWAEGLRWLQVGYSGPWTALLVGLGSLGWLSMVWHGGRPTRLLALSAPAILAAYPLLGVPFYTWYSIPVLIALLYGLSFLGGEGLRRGLRSGSRGKRLAAATLVVALVAPVVVHASKRIWAGYRHFAGMPRIQVYRSAGEWLAEHTAPNERIAFVEVGAVAFYSRRPVYDLLGLTSPEASIKPDQPDLTAAFLARPSEVVLYSPRLHSFMDPVRRLAELRTGHRKVAEFRAGDETLVVYRQAADGG